MKTHPESTHPLSRRQFLKSSTTVAVVAAPAMARAALAQEWTISPGETLRVGLVGCGGHGTGAAAQALAADANVKLVALGDAFPDRLQGSLETLRKQTDITERIEVPQERRFVGLMGSKGTAAFRQRALEITTDTKWTYDGEKNNNFVTEHEALFASIRSGKPANNGDYMSKTTLMAILGRMATYTGQKITWDQAMNSQESLSPDRYDWEATPPKSEIAIPGVTQFL
jgi:hypothetical protein